MVPVNDLLRQIEEETIQLHLDEGNLVLKAISLGKLFVALKCSVRPHRWLKELKKLNYQERDARRYLAIGSSWWHTAQTTASELLTGLPYDLHKLEALSRLDQAQLEELSRNRNLRSDSRGEIFSRVQAILGREDDTETTVSAPSVADIKKRIDGNVNRILEVLDTLPGDATDEQRLEIFATLQVGFEEFEKSLMAPAIQQNLEPGGGTPPVQSEAAVASAS
jgi:hypothetical protein